jgi:hypothetical protein
MAEDMKNPWYYVSVPMSWEGTFTWLLGKAEVRRVSCVSSTGFRFGLLRIKAAWSMVAAEEVIL